jgi:hypothetical protein
MTESFFIKNRRVATELTEAQSVAVELESFALVKFRYRTDEKTVELPLTTEFLKRTPYSKARNYLDNCIRLFLAKN